MEEYTPSNGFYDLRKFSIPAKEFAKFYRVQRFLCGWERARKRGQKVPDGVKNISAQYQQALFSYERRKTDGTVDNY